MATGTLSIMLRGQRYEVTYETSGYEPDTNAEEVEYNVLECPFATSLTKEEDAHIIECLGEHVQDSYGDEPDLEDHRG